MSDVSKSNVEFKKSNVGCRMSDVGCRMSDVRCGTLTSQMSDFNKSDVGFLQVVCRMLDGTYKLPYYSPPVQISVRHRQYGLRTVFLSYRVSGFGKLFRFRRSRKLHIFSFGLFHDTRKQATPRLCCQTIGVS